MKKRKQITAKRNGRLFRMRLFCFHDYRNLDRYGKAQQCIKCGKIKRKKSILGKG